MKTYIFHGLILSLIKHTLVECQQTLVQMSDFKGEFQRGLDCWDCFKVGGRMCHGKNYASIMQYTYSSNLYKGVCCKPGSTDDMCNGKLLDCSMDSVGAGSGDKYRNVLTNNRNYLMFSYCPGLSQATCAIGNDNNNRDTTLKAV